MLRITGIEQTQSTQYFDSIFQVCGPPGNPQPCTNNSVPLVQGKPLAIRVYFEGAASDVPVTGFGVKLLPDGSPSATSFPGDGDLVNIPSPAVREDPRQSLNLLIPSYEAFGDWKLSLTLFEKPVPGGLGRVVFETVDLSFIPRALISIRLVRMHYTGNNLDIPPPTMADFWQMMDFVQRAWPVSLPGICVVHESVEIFDGRFSNQWDPDPGTTGTLWDILARLRASEGLPWQTIYFALYPNDAGANGGGCVDRSFIAPNVLPWITAHELGHAFGLPHAPTPAFGPTFDGTDQSFPRYGTLPWGSIGEVGFDPRSASAFHSRHFDNMGYDTPRWIAPYQYLKLFTAIGPPVPGPCSKLPYPGSTFRDPIQKFFTCYFVEGEPGKFIRKLCGPKIPFEYGPPVRRGLPDWPVRAKLFDARGEVLFEDTFEVSQFSEPHLKPRQHFFSIVIPEIDGARRLLVTHGEGVVEDSELSFSTVAFEAKAQAFNGANPAVRVQWSLSPKNKNAPVFVRASSDNGRTWTAYNVPSRASKLNIDPASLPPGESCVVEVLAGERLRTTAWRSENLLIKTGAGRDDLLVLRPGKKSRVTAGESIELAAVASSGKGVDEITWSSDRDGELGKGGFQTVRLSPGKHVLSVRRGASGKPEAAGVVTVASPASA